MDRYRDELPELDPPVGQVVGLPVADVVRTYEAQRVDIDVHRPGDKGAVVRTSETFPVVVEVYDLGAEVEQDFVLNRVRVFVEDDLVVEARQG